MRQDFFLGRIRLLFLCPIFLVVPQVSVAANAISSFGVPGQPFGIVTGPDGALWITDAYLGAIDRMSTNGAVKQHKLPPASIGPHYIIRAHDNALWYVTQSGYLGTVHTDGRISERKIPTQDCVFFAIAQSKGGSIWTTNLGAASNDTAVFRYSSEGGFKRFSVPWREGLPLGITAGPDGAMWMTDNDVDVVARISEAGAFTVYHLPSGRAPSGIVSGPDGALWFTEEAGAIGRMTTKGQLNEFPVPTNGAVPDRITVGPDHALWFTEWTVGKVGRITMTGKITEYSLMKLRPGESPPRPFDITTGPDGALWVTDSESDSVIWRIDPKLLPTTGGG